MPSINMVTSIPGPKSRAVLDRKAKVVAEALSVHAEAVIDTSSGATFTDLDGNTFLDFSGGIGCHTVGYSHPKVIEAATKAAARFTHTDFTVIPYESYIELAERLVALCGGDRKVFLANSGAEAVENAVKIARAATGRPAIICFDGAFHGRTLLAMSLTSAQRPYKVGFGPFAPEIYRVPYPYPYRHPRPETAGREALDAIERAFLTLVDPHNVAAVIVEPIQGEGGFVVPPAEFLQGLQELCARHGVLTIADEIQTGFGRTGSFLASDTFGFDPDIITLGKSLASGLPLSAVVGRSEIMDAPGDNAIGGTYVGNPVACAAAIAVLDVIEEEGLIERAEHIGKDIRSRWEEIGEQMPQLGDIRGVGAMIGVEFVKDPDTKAPAKDLIGRLVNGALQKGVVSISCGIHKNVLRHLMPLVITEEQLTEGLDVLTDAALAARG